MQLGSGKRTYCIWRRITAGVQFEGVGDLTYLIKTGMKTCQDVLLETTYHIATKHTCKYYNSHLLQLHYTVSGELLQSKIAITIYIYYILTKKKTSFTYCFCRYVLSCCFVLVRTTSLMK